MLTPDGTPGVSTYSYYNPTGTSGGAASWQASTAYAVGATVQPALSNGFYYICTTAGTSGATQPVWPTTANIPVTDGTVTWNTIAAPVTSFIPDHLLNSADTAQIVGLALYRVNTADPTSLRVVVAARVKNSATNGYYGMLYGLSNVQGAGFAEVWSFQTTGGLRASPVIGTYADGNSTVYLGDESGLIYALCEQAGTLVSRWVTNGNAPYAVPTVNNAPVTATAAVSDDGMTLDVETGGAISTASKPWP